VAAAIPVHALCRQRMFPRAVEELLRVTVRRKSGNAVDAVLADPAAFSAEVLLAVLQSPASKPPELKRKGSPTELTGLRRRAWAPVGQEAHVMREATRSQNLALIVVLGLVPGNKHGVIASHWKPGRYPRTASISFLEEDYLPAMAAFRKKPPAHERDRKVSLNMDNCRTHVSQDVQDAVAHAGVEVVYILSYSPVNNPCELTFSRSERPRASLPRLFCLWRRLDGESNVCRVYVRTLICTTAIHSCVEDIPTVKENFGPCGAAWPTTVAARFPSTSFGRDM